MHSLEQRWYQPTPPPLPLRPLARLFEAAARRRRRQYLKNVADGSLWRAPVPVIVVGNITVGGTGKTPVVIALVEFLRSLGLRPGVVSRGYGGKPSHTPLQLDATTPVAECGDEPFMIHRRLGVPLVVDPNRRQAVEHLLASNPCDVIISDDGLQHYKLHRDIELLVIDGERGLGNGWCLPAGPLREPAERADSVDAVLVNGHLTPALNTAAPVYSLQLEPSGLHNMHTGERAEPGELCQQGSAVHGVAGIGNPPRFFNSLRELGCEVVEHPFADHFKYDSQDIEFKDNKPVIMTEKDAVKCLAIAGPQHWYLAVDVTLPEPLRAWLAQRLDQLGAK